jgi:acyl-CoA dehydrogenase
MKTFRKTLLQCVSRSHARVLAPQSETLAHFWPRFESLNRDNIDSRSLALAGGFNSDRLTWAFLAGYESALHALKCSRSGEVNLDVTRRALCATESRKGAHPRSIETVLVARDNGAVLNGSKSFVTMGSDAQVLLVFARLTASDVNETNETNESVDDDANDRVFRIVEIQRRADGTWPDGVRVCDADTSLPFIAELSHAKVTFDNVSVDAAAQCWRGEAWSSVVRPFRFVEDTHVSIAIVGYLLRLAAMLEWPDNDVAALVAHAHSLAALLDDSAHGASEIAAAGLRPRYAQLLKRATEHIDAAEASHPALHVLWHRDQPLFQVAKAARDARAARLFSKL